MITSPGGCILHELHWGALLALLTAHFAADFVLQTDRDIERAFQWKIFLKHIALVALSSYLLLGLWTSWLPVAVILVTHASIDWMKRRSQRKGIKVFLLDQFLHISVISLVAVFLRRNGIGETFWFACIGPAWTKTLIFGSGLATSVFMGSVVIGFWAHPLRVEAGNDTTLGSRGGLENGGKTIGMLERGLIFILVFIGKPEAVAFLIAAKSVFRFGELKDPANRMEAEYITIGTLMSFAWGFVTALCTNALLNLA
jgi:hypothetical protein